MDILSPEVIETLAQLGAVILILLVLLGIVTVLQRMVSPLSALASVIKSTQSKVEDSQERLIAVVQANTDSHLAIEELVKTLGHGQVDIREHLGGIEALLRERGKAVDGGVIIFNAERQVVYAGPRALDILGGWSIDQLPGGGRRFKQDVLTALNRVLPEDWFPSHKAADTGRVIENIPLQIFDYEHSRYKWLMVSAYPCIGCQSGLQTKADWVTLIIKEIGDMTAMP